MINRVFCPITSYQKQYQSGTECMEEACAFWDEERGQCCIKSAALAVAGNKNGGETPQTQYVYSETQNGTGNWNPQPYGSICQEKDLADQYIFNGGL